MSYILDALRKSETERRQGKIPDLGHQMQLIHRPKKKRISAVAWIAIALILNAGVLAAVFWPRMMPVPAEAASGSAVAGAIEAAPKTLSENPAENRESAVTGSTDAGETQSVPESTVEPEEKALASTDQPPRAQAASENALAESGGTAVEEMERERATIIVPSAPAVRENPVLPEEEPGGRVPHLVELPLSFQKSVPDLTFNSHIYASDPHASRVMINNNYLRRGDSFSGLRVDRITEDGVILSKGGQRFRVGTVRDWVSPR